MSNLGVSVVQAILQREGQNRLSTSSQRLDHAFLGVKSVGADGNKGGIVRGTVGEIQGPPGSGKTYLA
jgi:RecA/RadA recombinase